MLDKTLLEGIWKDPRGVENGTDFRNTKNIKKIHRHYFAKSYVENAGNKLIWQEKQQ